jgi:ribonuclease-3
LYEAVIGAIYLDAGFEQARASVLATMRDAIDATASSQTKSAKTQLQEWAQSHRLTLPVYRVLEATGPEHRRDFVVEVDVAGNVAQGAGASKREAQEAAASRLLATVNK